MEAKVLLGPSSFGKLDPAPLLLLQENGLEVIPNPYGRKLTQEELLELLPGVDGLIAGLETIDRKVLETSDLKVVSRCGSGISNVDVQACKDLGIEFKYTPYGPTQAVAELTLGMMLALLRNTFIMHASLAQGKWDKRIGLQLKGKTIAIIGFGRIGRRTAQLLEPFDVNLLAVDPDLEEQNKSVQLMALEDALPLADIVVLHTSGDEQILGPSELSLMKQGSFLLNPARGLNIDEQALLKALDNGQIAGAWLDCFSSEPYHGPLCDHPRAILTPHVGSYTREGRREMEMEAAMNLIEKLS